MSPNNVVVCKFGGGVLKNADAIYTLQKHIENLTREYKVVCVLSAMSNSTAILEGAIVSAVQKKDFATYLRDISDFYEDVARDTITERDLISSFMNIKNKCLSDIANFLSNINSETYYRIYDWVVSRGEIITLFLISHIFKDKGIEHMFVLPEELIVTDDIHVNAPVRIPETKREIEKKLSGLVSGNCEICLTAGFVGRTLRGEVATLGKEGSDLTAAIIAMSLNAKKLIFFKNSEGILLTDPILGKKSKTIRLLSIEDGFRMSATGSKVIHYGVFNILKTHGVPVVVYPFGNFDPEKGNKFTAIVGDDEGGNSTQHSYKTYRAISLLKLSSKECKLISPDMVIKINEFLIKSRIIPIFAFNFNYEYVIGVSADSFSIEKLKEEISPFFNVSIYNDVKLYLTHKIGRRNGGTDEDKISYYVRTPKVSYKIKS